METGGGSPVFHPSSFLIRDSVTWSNLSSLLSSPLVSPLLSSPNPPSFLSSYLVACPLFPSFVSSPHYLVSSRFLSSYPPFISSLLQSCLLSLFPLSYLVSSPHFLLFSLVSSPCFLLSSPVDLPNLVMFSVLQPNTPEV